MVIPVPFDHYAKDTGILAARDPVRVMDSETVFLHHDRGQDQERVRRRRARGEFLPGGRLREDEVAGTEAEHRVASAEANVLLVP
jgi:hypothetical protein